MRSRPAGSPARTVVVDPEPLFAQGVLACLTGRIDPPPVLADPGTLIPWPGPHGAAVIGVRRDTLADAEIVTAAARTATPVVVVGAPGNTRGIAELQRAGVRQILPRDCGPADLLAAVVGARGGPRATDRSNGSPGVPTRRELEVMTLLAKGLSNREIAEHLMISEHTVRNHLGHVFGKLAVSSRTQAVVKASEMGWLRLPG